MPIIHSSPSGDVISDLGQLYAQATCVALGGSGHISSVQRACSSSAPDCGATCSNLGKTCFNSLHIYDSSWFTTKGEAGIQTHIYNGCSGGCGPNLCCCRN